MAGATKIMIGRIMIVTLHDDALSELTDDFMSRLGEWITLHAASGVVIDVAPLSIVDSHLSRVLSDLVGVAGLLGARAILAGIRPDIAITMVELGAHLPRIHTAMNVELALLELQPRGGARD